MAAFARWERERFILWGALLPPLTAEAEPCAGPGAHGRRGRRACIALRRRRALGPAGRPGGCRRPRPARLAQALGTLAAPGAPGRRAAAGRHRRQARLFLAVGGGGNAVAWCAAGDEEAGRTHGPSPWPGVPHRAVGRRLGAVGAGGVDSGARRPGDPKWGNQGVPQEGMGRDAPRIRGPGAGRAEGLETAREARWRAPRRVPENAGAGGAPGAGHGVQGGPATQDVANERGLFVRQPVPHLGDRGLERPGQALGQADGVAHHAAAMGDAWRPGTPGRALGGRGGSVSRGVSSPASGRAAAVGSSVARLGGQASRERASGSGCMGQRTRTSAGRTAETSGPGSRARQTARRWPVHHVRRVVPQASMASGGGASGQPSRWAVPAAGRPPAWVAAAQSIPRKAAQVSGAGGVRRPLPAGVRVATRDRHADVRRRQEREPGARQARRRR